MKSLAQFTNGTWALISILFLVLIGANTYLSRATIAELNELQLNIRHSGELVDLLQKAHTNLLTAESGQRGFLITQDIDYLHHYENAIAQIKEVAKVAPSLFLEINKQSQDVTLLFELIDKKIVEMGAVVTKAQNEKFTQAIRLIESDAGRILYTNIRALIADISARENESRAQQILHLKKVTDESQRNVIISFFTSVLLMAGLIILARANLVSQRLRQQEIENRNEKLSEAVAERTKELSLFSDELARSNRELEDFAFVASHDLQEPLRKILAFGDRLQSTDSLTDKQQDYLKRMRGAASRMSTLISDLLEFSRITTRGKAFQKLDLNALLEACVDDLAVLIDETNVSLHIDDLPSIQGDPTQIRQLFFNLLANAIKFSASEENPKVTLTVNAIAQPDEIEVDDLGQWYTFSIVDNGIGFEQEYAEKIFAPFQRLHSRQAFKGTGIGLAICRRIVERHNGLISATGNIEEGAIFDVCLPTDNYLISIKQ
ncbi:MAG: ATP-binding protein [Glaciecola sp.]